MYHCYDINKMDIAEKNHIRRLEIVMKEQSFTSRPQLAESIGINAKTVQKWFEPQRSIPPEGAKEMHERFGYSIPWLLFGIPPKMALPQTPEVLALGKILMETSREQQLKILKLAEVELGEFSPLPDLNIP